MERIGNVLLYFDPVVSKSLELNNEVERRVLDGSALHSTTQLSAVGAHVQVVSVQYLLLEETLQALVKRLLLLDFQVKIQELLLSARSVVAVHTLNLA